MKKPAGKIVTLKRLLHLTIMLLTFLGFSACKKRPVLNAPASKTQGIAGTWKLYLIEQVDVNNKLGNIRSDTVLDVTSVYLGSKTPMQLSISASGTYSLSPGVADSYFKKTSGNWKFNNNDYPTMLIMDNATAEENRLFLLTPTRPQDPVLGIKASKVCSGRRTVSYNLFYKRM